MDGTQTCSPSTAQHGLVIVVWLLMGAGHKPVILSNFEKCCQNQSPLTHWLLTSLVRNNGGLNTPLSVTKERGNVESSTGKQDGPGCLDKEI